MTRAEQVLHLHPVRADGSLQYVAMQMPALSYEQVSAKNFFFLKSIYSFNLYTY